MSSSKEESEEAKPLKSRKAMPTGKKRGRESDDGASSRTRSPATPRARKGKGKGKSKDKGKRDSNRSKEGLTREPFFRCGAESTQNLLVHKAMWRSPDESRLLQIVP